MRSRTVTLSTCVENTAFPYFSFTAPKDHLHIRGEYNQSTTCRRWARGSPPHTWRIPSAGCANFFIIGITSTYVENTETGGRNNALARDHLHIRGEYSRAVTSLKMNGGSPPHTWRIRALAVFAS